MAAQTDERIRILGIRHHGPGSAALLRKALDVLDPACILVEGPPEGDELIQYVADPDLKPPVAMLLHAADEANLASFMPFAEFSPEWQAIQWALKRGRPIRFIDWPAAVSLALQKTERENPETAPQPRADALDLRQRRDPTAQAVVDAGHGLGAPRQARPVARPRSGRRLRPGP